VPRRLASSSSATGTASCFPSPSSSAEWPSSALAAGSSKTLYLAVICIAILAIAVLAGRGGASHAEKLHAKLMEANPEAWFGRDGVFCDGVFTQWLSVSVYLVSAAIDQRQPRSLDLRFEKSVPNPYGPTQIVPIHQAVLIPANADGDLARLHQELTARCPKAQIALA